jgi:hypothetical protein
LLDLDDVLFFFFGGPIKLRKIMVFIDPSWTFKAPDPISSLQHSQPINKSSTGVDYYLV